MVISDMGDTPADTDVVTCPACGAELERREAREYDRFGDRWERAGKTFEYLCKPCYRRACHLPRHGLEDTLVAVGHHTSPAAFVSAFYEEVGAEERRNR